MICPHTRRVSDRRKLQALVLVRPLPLGHFYRNAHLTHDNSIHSRSVSHPHLACINDTHLKCAQFYPQGFLQVFDFDSKRTTRREGRLLTCGHRSGRRAPASGAPPPPTSSLPCRCAISSARAVQDSSGMFSWTLSELSFIFLSHSQDGQPHHYAHAVRHQHRVVDQVCRGVKSMIRSHKHMLTISSASVPLSRSLRSVILLFTRENSIFI